VAQLHGGATSRESLWRNLFSEADRALYMAKQRGRDQFVLGSSMVIDETPEAPEQAPASMDCATAA